MLPHLAAEDVDYVQVYEGWCASDEQFVILDNGVAEDVAFDWGQLVDMAIYYGVNELVIPDAMRDYQQTLQWSEDFTGRFGLTLQKENIDLMFVAQATCWNDLTDIIDYAADNPHIQTIALPRHLPETTKFDGIRSTAAVYTAQVTKKPVH